MHKRFIFATCQAGAERALKEEIPRNHPELRFAFSRPGFLTFKITGNEGYYNPGFELKSVFARAYGLSVRKTDLEHLAANIPLLRPPSGTMHLHLWERDCFPPGEEPAGYARGETTGTALGDIKALHAFDDSTPASGARVLDVIVLERDSWWLGYHDHNRFHPPFAGGIPVISLPPEAPSRAYLKIEEAILWSGAAVRSGDTAVEIGSAPGGASFALLTRGLKVTGIDPGEMDARVLSMPGFEHVKKNVNAVGKADLPARAEWLLLDMNVEPGLAQQAANRILAHYGDSLLGAFLTIKLNNWSLAGRIPGILEKTRKAGFAEVRARQLFNNRREFCIFGLTKKGLRRRS